MSRKQQEWAFIGFFCFVTVGWLAMVVAIYIDDRRANPEKPDVLTRWAEAVSDGRLPPWP